MSLGNTGIIIPSPMISMSKVIKMKPSAGLFLDIARNLPKLSPIFQNGGLTLASTKGNQIIHA